jgi:NHL repeat
LRWNEEVIKFNGAQGTERWRQVIDGTASGEDQALAVAVVFFVASPRQNRVYKVAADGLLTVVAGTSSNGFSGDGGPATSAQLFRPVGVVVDSGGNLFIADSGNNFVGNFIL